MEGCCGKPLLCKTATLGFGYEQHRWQLRTLELQLYLLAGAFSSRIRAVRPEVFLPELAIHHEHGAVLLSIAFGPLPRRFPGGFFE